MRGDMQALSDAAGAGIAAVERDRGKVNSPYLQDGYLRHRRRLYDMGVFAAYKLGNYDVMLERADLAKARGILAWATAPDTDGGVDREDELETEFRAVSDAGRTEPEVAIRRRVLWGRLTAARARDNRRPALPPVSVA